MTAPIWAAIAAAQRDVEALARDGKNEHHRYRYTTSEAVIDEARRALSAHGLALFCLRADLHHEDVVETTTSEHGEVRDRSTRIHTLRALYLLTHESATQEIFSETPVIPEKGRPLDKALAAAKTYDLAYTLRSLLLIPRSDALAREADVDQRDDRATPAPATRTAPPAGDAERLIAQLDAATTRDDLDRAMALASSIRDLPKDHPTRLRASAARAAAMVRIEAAS